MFFSHVSFNGSDAFDGCDSAAWISALINQPLQKMKANGFSKVINVAACVRNSYDTFWCWSILVALRAKEEAAAAAFYEGQNS